MLGSWERWNQFRSLGSAGQRAKFSLPWDLSPGRWTGPENLIGWVWFSACWAGTPSPACILAHLALQGAGPCTSTLLGAASWRPDSNGEETKAICASKHHLDPLWNVEGRLSQAPVHHTLWAANSPTHCDSGALCPRPKSWVSDPRQSLTFRGPRLLDLLKHLVQLKQTLDFHIMCQVTGVVGYGPHLWQKSQNVFIEIYTTVCKMCWKNRTWLSY